VKLHTKIAVLAFDQPSLYVSQGEQDYQETKKISIPDHPDENIHSVLHGSMALYFTREGANFFFV
jgi:hypothetical protein